MTPEKIEKLISLLLKPDPSIGQEPHIDEELIVCFTEGKLGAFESEIVKKHLLNCSVCADNFKAALEVLPKEEFVVPADIISKVKNLPGQESGTCVALEIILNIKNNLLELLRTNGDVLVGQELVPAPVLRSRNIKDFKDEVFLFKDFENVRVEIKIEKKSAVSFNLELAVKNKQTAQSIPDLRITLIKNDIELESYIIGIGKVRFEDIALGSYLIDVLGLEEKLAGIVIDVKG